MEIPTRPQPREVTRALQGPLVHAVVLAAGQSSRMGGPNKLLALFGGKPLIRRMVERAVASRAAGTVVVAGHQADRVRAALFGVNVELIDNPDYNSGLASSLKAGIAALPDTAAGALVVLGDMPEVSSDRSRPADFRLRGRGWQFDRTGDPQRQARQPRAVAALDVRSRRRARGRHRRQTIGRIGEAWQSSTSRSERPRASMSIRRRRCRQPAGCFREIEVGFGRSAR